MFQRRIHQSRTGGVYIAVLATALVVALLSMSALIGQRLQNRMIVAQGDVQQAQLNANSAIELALLTMKQDANWRTTYTNGNWFVKRSATAGTSTVNVTDPIDGNLANNPDDSVVVLGIGYSGEAEQRMKVIVDPRKDPLSCLRSAIAVGDAVTLNSDTLRANNSLITANSISATGAQVYGKIEALSTTGSTFNSTPTVVTSDKLPSMPDWTSVFNYYKNNGTQIDINSLPTQTPNLARNAGIENGENDWTGNAPGMSTADVDQSNNAVHSGNNGLRVRNRNAWYAGAE
jgi:Tfp pilus assembly protein PilX